MSIGSIGSLAGTAVAFELQASRAKDRLRSRGVPDVVVNAAENRAEKLGAPSTTDTAATYRPWPTYTTPAPERLGSPSSAAGNPSPLGEPATAPQQAPEQLGKPSEFTAATPVRLGAPSAASESAPAPERLGDPSAAFEPVTRQLGAPTSAAQPPPEELGAPAAEVAPPAERLGSPTEGAPAGTTRRLGGPVAFTADVPVPLGRPEGF